MIRVRDSLVESRTKLISTVRGMVKTMGARLPGCSSVSFSQKSADQIPHEVRETLQPILRLIQMLSEEIKGYEKRIEKLASEKYMDTNLLRQVNGVGPVTSLAYVLTLETPQRFKRSRDVGPYLGLVPSRRIPETASRSWASARLATRCCANCWWAARTTSWAHSGRTQTYDDSE